jgi:pSer/pThr/pTyr-binding forkhead associated (FHA) protein
MIANQEITPDDRTECGLLRWKDDDQVEKTFRLREGDTVQIGRVSDNNVVLNNSHVSRHHAVLVWRGEGFELSDLGSSNGTLINGERVTQPRVLQNGDVIRLYSIDVSYHEIKNEAARTDGGPEEHKTYVVLTSTPQANLTVSAGPQEGLKIPLHAGKMIIGRATVKDKWDIALQDRSISRPHAQLEQGVDGGFVLTDMGSANGTLVNSSIIAEPTLLHDGDVIVVGETSLLFREK